MNNETIKMIKKWKKNYSLTKEINISDFESRIQEHKENGYYIESFFLLLTIVEYNLRKLIITRNLRLAILSELDNNLTFGYYIDFDDKYLSLGKLKNAFETFFKKETNIVGLLKKILTKRNKISHFLLDNSLDGKRLLFSMVNKNELKDAENLKKELDELIKIEHDEMNSLQSKIDKIF